MSHTNRNRWATFGTLLVTVVLLCVVFFEKINGLLTFTYTKEITLTRSEEVTVGLLDVASAVWKNGIFNSVLTESIVIGLFAIGLLLMILRDKANSGYLQSCYRGGEFPVFAMSFSNRTKIWYLALSLYVFLEVVTDNFNLNRIAHVWRFNFNGGASVPTSPISLTDVGTMIEYHYAVSIKRFFVDADWSYLEYAAYSIAVIWCLAKAHTISARRVNEAESNSDALAMIPAAVLALVTAVFAPYRLASSTDKESLLVRDDVLNTMRFLRLPESFRNWMQKHLEDDNSMVSALEDKHGSYTHQLMAAMNKKVE